VRTLRHRQQRNFLTTLFVSQGVPMLCGGDELSRTQGGNNNAYCQDNELSWYDWGRSDEGQAAGDGEVGDLVDFTRRLIRLRRDNPAFRRQSWFAGRPIGHHGEGEERPDIAWFTPGGAEMEDENWGDGRALCLAVFVNGNGLQARDPRGQRIVGDSFLLLFNAYHESMPFVVPDAGWAAAWTVEIDSADPSRGRDEPETVKAGDTVAVDGRSVQVLRAQEPAA
jgi:isoamylase